MTPDDLKQCLADPWWRLTSGKLYKIMVKDGDEDEDLAAIRRDDDALAQMANSIEGNLSELFLLFNTEE